MGEWKSEKLYTIHLKKMKKENDEFFSVDIDTIMGGNISTGKKTLSDALLWACAEIMREEEVKKSMIRYGNIKRV